MTTQSTAAVNLLSTLVAQISKMREVSKLGPVKCLHHADHRLDVLDAYLAAYQAAGNKVADLQCSENLSHSMVMMVRTICDIEYWGKTAMSERVQYRLLQVVNKVVALSEMMDESCYGLDASDVLTAFNVQTEDLTQETKYAPKV